jgi:hypothetical protein
MIDSKLFYQIPCLPSHCECGAILDKKMWDYDPTNPSLNLIYLGKKGRYLSFICRCCGIVYEQDYNILGSYVKVYKTRFEK